MHNILIVSGSVYGTATVVAEDLKIALEKSGYSVTHQEGGDSRILEDDGYSLMIICTSTTGSGDIPANLGTFYEELEEAPPKIAGKRYAVIALGDSSYGETFCGAGLAIDRAMTNAGGQNIAEPLLLDALEHTSPEDNAIEWISTLLEREFPE